MNKTRTDGVVEAPRIETLPGGAHDHFDRNRYPGRDDFWRVDRPDRHWRGIRRRHHCLSGSDEFARRPRLTIPEMPLPRRWLRADGCWPLSLDHAIVA